MNKLCMCLFIIIFIDVYLFLTVCSELFGKTQQVDLKNLVRKAVELLSSQKIIDVYRKSEYIPTVTNFASILANGFYFLRKITVLRPSVLNF